MTSLFFHRTTFIAAITFAMVFAFVCVGVVTAWTGPSGTAPNNNVSAPINVGTVSQIKDGALGVNSIAVYGNGYVQSKLGVGIVSPTFNLDVKGIGQFGASPAGPGGRLQTNGSVFELMGINQENNTFNALQFSTGSTPSLYITTSGNVGIGTSAPGYKLDVTGNIRSTAEIIATAFYYSSDARLKKNVRSLDGLDAILRLRGVSFDWNENGKPSVGLIAQEVEEVLPQIVTTDPYTGMKSVQYGNLVAPLIEAVKAQQVQIQQLEERLRVLENK